MKYIKIKKTPATPLENGIVAVLPPDADILDTETIFEDGVEYQLYRYITEVEDECDMNMIDLRELSHKVEEIHVVMMLIAEMYQKSFLNAKTENTTTEIVIEGLE